ncbi:hypothetical protein DKX38_009285 [Salix brachista]|uniref:L-dopachrome isomerase n=1 Tax=Salix brachista TaxID=2182728 RepID=A0A5N5MA01_9ROSI|nr:hypothetical protein DKX38_009285 [Salix brachista]
MPTLNLHTNIPVDAVTTSDILKDATKALSKIIGKPESVEYPYVMVVLHGGVPIVFAGTEAPAAFAEVISIGGLGQSVNAKLSSTIADILQTKLSIDSSRFYIKFFDSPCFINSIVPMIKMFSISFRLLFFLFPDAMLPFDVL